MDNKNFFTWANTTSQSILGTVSSFWRRNTESGLSIAFWHLAGWNVFKQGESGERERAPPVGAILCPPGSRWVPLLSCGPLAAVLRCPPFSSLPSLLLILHLSHPLFIPPSLSVSLVHFSSLWLTYAPWVDAGESRRNRTAWSLDS